MQKNNPSSYYGHIQVKASDDWLFFQFLKNGCHCKIYFKIINNVYTKFGLRGRNLNLQALNINQTEPPHTDTFKGYL